MDKKDAIKWTLEELTTHIKTNVESYGSVIVVAALYKKLYGKYPKIGLSGFQATAIDSIVEKLPESKGGNNNE